jgi:ribosomal protein S18 acetylase RimI-like enzyme
VHLCPGTSFVLDDGHGRVVGYCIGTADTTSFAQRWVDEFVPTVDSALVPRPDVTTGDAAMDEEGMRGFRKGVYEADCSMLVAWPHVLAEYPAHMHIDIVPEFQRQGWGTVLLDAFLQAAKKEGTKGLHLGMLRSNESAKLFYEKVGFEVCPVVMDGGESGEKGVNGVVLHLVKYL